MKFTKRLVDACTIWNHSHFDLSQLQGARIYIKALFLLHEWKSLIYLHSFSGVSFNFDCIAFSTISTIHSIWRYWRVMFVKYRGSFIFSYYYVFLTCKFLKSFKLLNLYNHYVTNNIKIPEVIMSIFCSYCTEFKFSKAINYAQ